jgi:hypothetical protein
MNDTTTTLPRVRLDDLAQRLDETSTLEMKRDESTYSPVREISFETIGATALAQVIDIERLWEAPPGTTSQIVRALELLKQAIDFLADARKSDNPMDSDRFVQRAQLTLPKLFACRSIGDGFGVIVNSLHFAFVNAHGTPLTPDQLNVAWRVLRELRTHPVMSLEQGIQYAEDIENCGLVVDPPELGSLLEGYESGE